jgi:hypothetical protein
MPIEPIGQARAPVEAQVFVDGQRLYVAEAASAEIASAGVMGRMHALPVILRSEHEDAQGAADPVVDPVGAKEGAVPTIMLDREESVHEPRFWPREAANAGGHDG